LAEYVLKENNWVKVITLN